MTVYQLENIMIPYENLKKYSSKKFEIRIMQHPCRIITLDAASPVKRAGRGFFGDAISEEQRRNFSCFPRIYFRLSRRAASAINARW